MNEQNVLSYNKIAEVEVFSAYWVYTTGKLLTKYFLSLINLQVTANINMLSEVKKCKISP